MHFEFLGVHFRKVVQHLRKTGRWLAGGAHVTGGDGASGQAKMSHIVHRLCRARGVAAHCQAIYGIDPGQLDQSHKFALVIALAFSHARAGDPAFSLAVELRLRQRQAKVSNLVVSRYGRATAVCSHVSQESRLRARLTSTARATTGDDSSHAMASAGSCVVDRNVPARILRRL